MQTALQLVMTGLQIGSVYMLFSLGLTLIFGVMKIVNFAHGQFFTLSAMLVAVLVPWLTTRGISLPMAFGLGALAGIAASIVVGLLLYQFGFRFFQRDLVGSFILSIGFALLFEGVFLHYFGGAVRVVPPIIDGDVSFFGVNLTAQRLTLGLVALAFTLALYWVLSATRLGKAMRAVSIDHEAAMLQGIPYKKIVFNSFAIATFLGAVAGAIMAPISVITPTVGADYLVKGFIAVVIGGLGSVPGAIVGSLFIGFLESVGGYFFDPSSANMAIFVLAMLILLLRPKGVMGNG